MKKVLHNLVLLAMIPLAFLSTAPVMAAFDETFFAENNIIYYDPDGAFNPNVGCSSYGSVSVTGSESAEKLWNGLISLGFTPEQTAGILGNMQSESAGTLNPVVHEVGQLQAHQPGFDLFNGAVAYGIGLIQWSWGRRVNLMNAVKNVDPNLLVYFEDYEKYAGTNYGSLLSAEEFVNVAGIDILEKLYSIELQFLRNEIDNNSTYRATLSATTVEEATITFLEKVEVPAAYIKRNENPAAYENLKQVRLSQAQAFFERFSGYTGQPSASIDGFDVTIIGDSITNGSKSQILAKLPQADIHAQDSKQFAGTNASNPTGIEILDQLISAGKLRDIVVYALGTNNAGLTVGQVEDVVNKIGSSKTIIFVNNYALSESGKDYSSNNNALQSVKQSNANVLIADWAEAVASNPTRYITNSDGLGVHPTDEGKELFADVIFGALSNGTGATNTSTGCNGYGGWSGVGLSQEEAEEFISIYNSPVNYNTNVAYIGGRVNSSSCNGVRPLSNCTALSQYFVGKYTNLTPGGGNGNEVVDQLLERNPSLSWGTEPKPFAIFSQGGGSLTSAGHTGLILGVDVAANKVIIAESSCSGTYTSKLTMETLTSVMSHFGGNPSTMKFAYPEIKTDVLMAEGLL
ncbi:MAG: phage tail-type lysozyme domain-containing protein [Candidatus Nomurabacteria bacterium]|nr:phage tail-type lysozyme domain-containing protein [Candidatus Nomurabacteria bacterium]